MGRLVAMFYPVSGRRADETPSSRAARCQGLVAGSPLAGGGAVSARNCSIPATIAAASASEAPVETISIRGRGGRR
jgi:hypothetical protein